MNIRVVPEREVDSALDERIRAMLCVCFPDAQDVFSQTRAWHGSAPSWTVLAEDANEILCAHLGIVDRVIQVGAKPLRVAGIQNVCVLPARRGEGVAARLLEEAVALMGDCSFDAGLLFCTSALTRVYADCGWRVIDNTSVMCEDEDGRDTRLPDGSIPMWSPVHTTAWPTGDIHLRGTDW